MDRLFLDANVLFSAAYRHGAGLARLWQVVGAELVTSSYAIVEAERNLDSEAQLVRLKGLLEGVTEVGDSAVPADIVHGVNLPEKDLPILAAAKAANCTHLITGDVRHFGPHMGAELMGVLVLSPAEYLRRSNEQVGPPQH